MPVNIERRKTREGVEYWVAASGDETETNLVLTECLNKKYALQLPAFEGGSIEEYLASVSALAPTNLKWKLRRQVAFGIFPSARMAMYHDLNPADERVPSHDNIRALLIGKKCGPQGAYSDEYDVDAPAIEKKVPWLVKDADSSQFSALVDVADGRNLALEGPPGTGKSQTIVNAIAATIASGKTVLFVAEKLAALNVVRSRLEEVGIGEFALPLLAERSTRERVIDCVRERVEMQRAVSHREYETTLSRFRQVRSELATFISVMSSYFENTGFKVYDIIGLSIATSERLNAVPEALKFPEAATGKDFTRSDIERARKLAEAVEKAWKEADAAPVYWKGLSAARRDRFTIDRIGALAARASELYSKLTSAQSRIAKFGLSAALGSDRAKTLQRALERINEIGRPPDVAILRNILSDRDAFFAFLEQSEAWRQRDTILAGVVSDPMDQAVPAVLRRLLKLCESCRFTALDTNVIRAAIAADEERYKSYTALRDGLKPFIAVYPELSGVPVSSLERARQLVQSTARRVLAFRSAHFAEPRVTASIEAAARKAAELKGIQERLEPAHSLATHVAADLLQSHLNSLQSAGLLAILSGPYRKASRFCRTLSGAGAFDRASAIKTLADLIAWRNEVKEYTRRYAEVFQEHFSGLDTDFELFGLLAKFYEDVDRQFSFASDTALKDVLRTGKLDLLLAMPGVDGTMSCDFASLEQELARLKGDIEVRRSGLKELEPLITNLRHPLTTAPGHLAELALDIERHQADALALANSPIGHKVGGKHFSGPQTNRLHYETELAVADAVSPFRDFSGPILDAMDRGQLGEVTATVTELVASHDEVQSLVDALQKATGIDFNVKLSGYNSHQLAEYFRVAGEDRAGLLSNSEFAAALNDLGEVGLSWIASALLDLGKPLDGLGAIVEAVIARALAMRAFEKHGGILRKFPGAQLDAHRGQLALLDRQIIDMTRQHLRAKYNNPLLPRMAMGMGGGQPGPRCP